MEKRRPIVLVSFKRFALKGGKHERSQLSDIYALYTSGADLRGGIFCKFSEKGLKCVDTPACATQAGALGKTWERDVIRRVARSDEGVGAKLLPGGQKKKGCQGK